MYAGSPSALQPASRSACMAARMDLSPSSSVIVPAVPEEKPRAIIARAMTGPFATTLVVLSRRERNRDSLHLY